MAVNDISIFRYFRQTTAITTFQLGAAEKTPTVLNNLNATPTACTFRFCAMELCRK